MSETTNAPTPNSACQCAAPSATNGGTQKPRVALLYGGRSSERGVSVVTAAGVLGAIDLDKYEVVPIGITKGGQWVLKDPRDLVAATPEGSLPEVTADSPAEVVLSYESGDHALRIVEPGKVPQELGVIDVVFPVLHGPYGEDGSMQGLLELADVPYVGPGVLASAVGMDKHFMKIAFAAAGIHVGPYVVFRPEDWKNRRNEIMARVADLRFPLFVKPARAGSSFGITRIDSIDQLPDAVAEAQKHDPKVLVEEGITGREIECAVLGGRNGSWPRASLPGEIVTGDDWYSFDAKYMGDGDMKLMCPADLPDNVIEKVRDTAIQAYQAIDCEGLCRSDVFVTPDGEVIINEVNTSPGFTPISMYPKMWEATGIPYSELLSELIELARERPTGLR